ncbi:phosphotransferase [Kribbella jiaozuonensis]|uniref:Aminoglycoside phosphotransferase family protein n=1 Tax=Kribbella jiaozuonensis TaxID=2575441 RepID=A0A4U3LZR2_9ACTN|nr:phosphotransferase [Kribbella jiaozuonensis]TKK80327.1 aminoglycoside phosphotransferase family protein [Kribbella jiaozuonensis]
MIEDGEEIPLVGGDVTEGLVRVGDTVRRPPGERDELVRDVLLHLEKVGFDGAPRYLGVDSAGREVLTYIDGEVAGRPRPPWIADEERALSLARLLRAYHDAVEGFGIPQNLPAPIEPPGLPELDDPPELIGHQDVTPENVVFRNGRAYALIDFDMLRPVSRAGEVVNLMLWWAPFGEDADLDPQFRGLDQPRRCRLLADAYGLEDPDRSRLIDLAIRRDERSWHTMKYRAEILGGGWQRMWSEGVGDKIRHRQTWLEKNAETITTALLA